MVFRVSARERTSPFAHNAIEAAVGINHAGIMAGLTAAIHAFDAAVPQNKDARDKRGHLQTNLPLILQRQLSPRQANGAFSWATV